MVCLKTNVPIVPMHLRVDVCVCLLVFARARAVCVCGGGGGGEVMGVEPKQNVCNGSEKSWEMRPFTSRTGPTTAFGRVALPRPTIATPLVLVA